MASKASAITKSAMAAPFSTIEAAPSADAALFASAIAWREPKNASPARTAQIRASQIIRQAYHGVKESTRGP